MQHLMFGNDNQKLFLFRWAMIKAVLVGILMGCVLYGLHLVVGIDSDGSHEEAVVAVGPMLANALRKVSVCFQISSCVSII
jgi:hypothetical protein